MDHWEREYHVSRIISGLTRYRSQGRIYWIGPVSRESRYIASEVYREALRDAWDNELMGSEEVLALLIRSGTWTEKDDEQFRLLTDKLDELKVGLYEAWSNVNLRAEIRNAIHKGRDELQRLTSIRHSLDYITAEGVATSAKIRFLTGASLLRSDRSRYWTEPELDWLRPDELVDGAMEHLAKHRLDETAIRDIARNEPWRSIWSARQHCGGGLWENPSVDLLDEQRTLILWSSAYDSIREHPNTPSDDVIDDDDMLDGWMIIQRKKREADLVTKRGEEISSNPKIRDADEIYKMVETVEDARKIHNLNSEFSKQVKKQRFSHLKQMKEVSEARMPDTAQKLQMERARLEAEGIRQRKGR